MPSTRISKRTVDSAIPGARDCYLWDSELSGFGLKVTPSGAKTYLVQYRTGGRGMPTRRITIGRHGSPWTPEQARQEARRVLAAVDLGEDPAAAKADKRRDLTVSDLCDLYLAEGCTTKKSSTIRADQGRITWHIKPLLGKRKVGDITRADVERLLRDVATGKTASPQRSSKGGSRATGGKGAASQTVILLRAMFAFALARELREDNPATGIKTFQVRKLERFLTEEEMARLGKTLSDFEKKGANPYLIAAIRLLLLTGCRKSEILKLTWDCVDTTHSCLRLPDSKTGAKVVPLGRTALDTLIKLQRVPGNPYVISGKGGNGQLVNIDRTWEKIRGTAQLPDLRLHDLRHSFASVGAANGSSLLIIGKILGHTQPTTTQRYAHLANDPVLVAANKISAAIAGALDQPSLRKDRHHKFHVQLNRAAILLNKQV
ncbi:tyrosine-type recombinase/integrase [Niveispirillum sp. KHB5.9]|uniref:tyrosine-type recombinase/integrase n=1 Tax=Niveispirillum sp. KHB5.9 TaxID=3400269 RepID=UPI003A859904